MFDYLRVTNLRAFKDSGKIKLNPLTILVGKNSSGKSTLARVLPLLRQSVEVSTRGPILWFGNKYVDFGSFATAINSNADTKEITFEIGLKTLLGQFVYLSNSKKNKDDFNREIKIALTLCDDNKSTKLKSFSVVSDDLSIDVRNTSGSKAVIELNGVQVTSLSATIENAIDFGLLPDLAIVLEGESKSKNYYFDDNSKYKLDLLKKYSDSYKLKFESEESSNKFYSELLDITDLSFFGYKSNINYLAERHGIFESALKLNDEQLRQIWNDSVILNIPHLIMMVNHLIHEQMKNISYVAPVRAFAERYYRFQDLQVKELDHTGSNLAMLLLSLKNKHLSDFKGWIKKHLRFEISVDPVGNHYAISVKPEGYKKFHNLSDMGFGFSQILPVVVSMWMSTNTKASPRFRYFGDETNVDKIIVIEQPELHLHPEMQDILASTIVNVASNYKNLRIKFLIETHSKTFIDAIGRCIRAKEIDSDSVSINIVEHEAISDTSVVKQSSFNEQGQLLNWPLGFFSS
ncbi:AAA family ATPase [Pseudidiomarina andamanensis]|uniref:Endonuclease GajA/Old nuclease/RecF-like AAA domain-containing protein n=1 Tax=Pseudidiomarina andamanensis TaxID=1940690 RepID=A0AA92IL12_9GAMM|nr:AAA family ATPase [Pseudidiomarina andamanensis]MDS0217919.1 AAA family ATPase [Pseudidiomarina andamanensis]QGT94814.1 hypothetical protein D3795_00825 [Pseudidiomarina andamanensis]